MRMKATTPAMAKRSAMPATTPTTHIRDFFFLCVDIGVYVGVYTDVIVGKKLSSVVGDDPTIKAVAGRLR